MEHIKIRIQSLQDAENGEAIVDAATAENTTKCKSLTVGILEAGTVSGNTSVMFVLEMPDGTYAIAELTQGLLDGINGALKGAIERFGK